MRSRFPLSQDPAIVPLREALIHVIVSLCVTLGRADVFEPGRLLRALNKAMLRVRVPAESVLRRMITTAEGLLDRVQTSTPTPGRAGLLNGSSKHKPGPKGRRVTVPGCTGPTIATLFACRVQAARLSGRRRVRQPDEGHAKGVPPCPQASGDHASNPEPCREGVAFRR
jgi:hypothetical protein